MLTHFQNTLLDVISKKQPIRSSDLSLELEYSKETIRKELSHMVMMGIIDAIPGSGYYTTPQKGLVDVLNQVSMNYLMDKALVLDKEDSVYEAVIKMTLNQVEQAYLIDEKMYAVTISDLKTNQLDNAKGVQLKDLALKQVKHVFYEDTLLSEVKELLGTNQEYPVCINEKGLKIVGSCSLKSVSQYFVKQL